MIENPCDDPSFHEFFLEVLPVASYVRVRREAIITKCDEAVMKLVRRSGESVRADAKLFLVGLLSLSWKRSFDIHDGVEPDNRSPRYWSLNELELVGQYMRELFASSIAFGLRYEFCRVEACIGILEHALRTRQILFSKRLFRSTEKLLFEIARSCPGPSLLLDNAFADMQNLHEKLFVAKGGWEGSKVWSETVRDDLPDTPQRSPKFLDFTLPTLPKEWLLTYSAP